MPTVLTAIEREYVAKGYKLPKGWTWKKVHESRARRLTAEVRNGFGKIVPNDPDWIARSVPVASEPGVPVTGWGIPRCAWKNQ